MRKAGIDAVIMVILLISFGCIICYAIGLTKGQIAAIQGEIKYVLATQANGETVWVKKSQVKEEE